MMMLQFEAAVLGGLSPDWKQSGFSTADGGSLLQLVCEGDFEAVLFSSAVQGLLGGAPEEDDSIEAYLERQVLSYLSNATEDQRSDRETALLALAVGCLNLFAQSNWTGPPVELHISDFLPEALLQKFSQLLPWWTLRYVSLHQQILEERSPQLFNLMLGCIEKGKKTRTHFSKCEELFANNTHRNLAIQFHLECSYTCLTYYEYRRAKEHLQTARDLSGIDVNMTGALGKRTRFQENFVAQLILDVKRKDNSPVPNSESPSLTPTPKELLPKDHQLSDDTVLNQINLAEPSEHELPDLSAEEQSLILATCIDFQKNNPVHKLNDEELLAFTTVLAMGRVTSFASKSPLSGYRRAVTLSCDKCFEDIVLEIMRLVYVHAWMCAVDTFLHFYGICMIAVTVVEKVTGILISVYDIVAHCLLSQPKFWAVEVTSLCLRTKLERGSSRRVERAMMQTQTLVDYFSEKNCPVTERLKMFYTCRAPPLWDLQRQLASLLTDLGLTSSALLIYERLELWEDAVVCLERMGQHGKAEEILRRELEKKETPSLYCLLGDVLKDPQYYDRAWELSKHRSARAQRSKALHHLRHKELQQCVECFERSLQINSMQNAEAWNNLSTAYIRLRMKEKAFRTLQEALKCNYERWQIWENFIAVCIDLGEFSEAIRAYHRLMDLKDKYKDVEVLEILVRAVVDNLTDHRGEQSSNLKAKLQELFGRISARCSTDTQIWKQYARLYGDGHSNNVEDNEKALQFLSKAHRCETQAAGWEKDMGNFRSVVKSARDMANVSISCSRSKRNPQEALQLLSSARLSLKSLVTKAKQLYTDVATGELHDDLRGDVTELEQLITELQDLSAQLRSQ
ncbi:tetratricopeptide repeat 27 [Labeo rohita]|uniref:Tetratricopeptide repeat protein 27 n=2 Tax=Labeonini TaxID=2743697 RepID=A0A498N6Q2_LABRO|nr:tetratricopeptide repeat 27 [Labeo rohita]